MQVLKHSAKTETIPPQSGQVIKMAGENLLTSARSLTQLSAKCPPERRGVELRAAIAGGNCSGTLEQAFRIQADESGLRCRRRHCVDCVLQPVPPR
jgi:hypothetical protein